MKKIIYTLIIFGFYSCNSINKETKITNEAIVKSEKITQKAIEIFSRGTDSMEYIISCVDSAINVYPSEANYVLKWQYSMLSGNENSAKDAINEYWSSNKKGYTMAISTGLMYDLNNQRDSATIFYYKAKDQLSEIRDDHNDIFYKLDQKYIDILIYGSTDCKEYLKLINNNKDSLFVKSLIMHLDTLTLNTIKSKLTLDEYR